MFDGGQCAPEARLEARTRTNQILVSQQADRQVVTGREHQVVERPEAFEEALHGRFAGHVQRFRLEASGIGQREIRTRLLDPLGLFRCNADGCTFINRATRDRESDAGRSTHDDNGLSCESHYRTLLVLAISWLEGRVGSATFRAVAAPATGSMEESRSPSCTRTDA